MSSRMISGIEVQFPFETPYPAQIMVASKVLTALQKRQNALVESPTGTGKSLALLCSVLAYQKSLESVSDDGFIERKIPTVYYMSRTHSQLAQVVHEFSRTIYRPKMTILGSREQLCIRKRTGVSADENCHALLNEGACEYYFNTYRLRSALERSEVFDIEDLVKSGTSLKACPYFTTRALARPPGQSKFILCPYNYVVDMAVRRSLGLDLKNAILIFDEAHNIENVAREAASSTYQIPYLEIALNSLHDVEDSACLRSALQGLVNYMGQCADSMTTISFEHDAHIESGQRMLDILAEFGLGSDLLPAMRSSIQTLSARYRDDPEEADANSGENASGRHRHLAADGVDSNRVLAALRLCETLCSTLELLYREGATQHYRLALTRKANEQVSSWEYSLSFWCLSPSVAIEGIAKDAASIIVASGTLFPLGSFAAELGICFEQRVEAPHVISNEQVWVGVVPDVSNRHLTSTYNFANTLEFQDQLALTLIALATRIPAGMLVFLPSYALLDRLMTRWKQTRQFAELNRIKTVSIEDRKSGTNFDANVKKYRRLCGSKKGSIFFGVYRGKLSEGIDFANHDARAVVCVGIPFPNTKEAQVTLKQAHNTALLRADPNNPIPNGREWYAQQAYRALNQSVGRCIRHSRDYGAIIFIDARFQRTEVISNISKWVRKELVVYQTFSEVASKLEEFFTKMPARYPLSDEPEWKRSKPSVHTGSMDSFVKKWAVTKKPKAIQPPSESLDEASPVKAFPSDPEIPKRPTIYNDDPIVIATPFAPEKRLSASRPVAKCALPNDFAALSSSLDQFSYQRGTNSVPVCDLTMDTVDVPKVDPTPTPSCPSAATITYSGQTFNCRKCRSVLWDDPGQYEVRNQARKESHAALVLLRPPSLECLRPMEGYNDLHLVYDFPIPVPSSLKADNDSLYFSANLGVVLRRLSCRDCDADLGGEVIACNRSDLLSSVLGRSWILGAVLEPGRPGRQAAAPLDPLPPPPSLPQVSLPREPSDSAAMTSRAYQMEFNRSLPSCFPQVSMPRDPSDSASRVYQTDLDRYDSARAGSNLEHQEPRSAPLSCLPQASMTRDASDSAAMMNGAFQTDFDRYDAARASSTLENSFVQERRSLPHFQQLQPDRSVSGAVSFGDRDCQVLESRTAGSGADRGGQEEFVDRTPLSATLPPQRRSLQQILPKLQPTTWLPCKKGRFVKR